MDIEIPSADSAVRVLLVVDQPMVAGVIQLALNHGRATTHVASTADDGVTALATWRPHLAILDLDLVDGQFLDGLGGAARWRARPGDRTDPAGRSEDQAARLRARGR